MTDAFDPQPSVRQRAAARSPVEAASTPAPAPPARQRRAICALVWRRFRRSLHRHDRAGAGRACCSSSRSSPTSSRRSIPKAQNVAFAPPDTISFYAPDAGLPPPPARLSDRRDRRARPGHLPAARSAPTTTNPRQLGFFVKGCALQALRPDPARPALLRRRSTARRSTSSAPTSSAATSSPAASSARGSRSTIALIVGRASSRSIGTTRRHRLGLHRRPLRHLAAALRRARPRLPAAAALPGADLADPGHRAVQRLPRLRHRRHRRRSAGRSSRARCAARRWRWPASTMSAPRWRSAPATGASSSATSCPT